MAATVPYTAPEPYLVTATLAQKMTFLESNQVSVCDLHLLEQENSFYLVTESACDEIRARYSGYKWFQSKTLYFAPCPGLHQPYSFTGDTAAEPEKQCGTHVSHVPLRWPRGCAAL